MEMGNEEGAIYREVKTRGMMGGFISEPPKLTRTQFKTKQNKKNHVRCIPTRLGQIQTESGLGSIISSPDRQQHTHARALFLNTHHPVDSDISKPNQTKPNPTQTRSTHKNQHRFEPKPSGIVSAPIIDSPTANSSRALEKSRGPHSQTHVHAQTYLIVGRWRARENAPTQPTRLNPRPISSFSFPPLPNPSTHVRDDYRHSRSWDHHPLTRVHRSSLQINNNNSSS